ncbi:MAG: 1-acyl-sn-glycerol-3-phosphate acyltransferase [Candidatus Cloacimonetes bacterium]|nr:1-acyl-sn-glycerol-3-phosphate acyltransferase [Candidatus Cloacimonadota bacterium]MDY0171716.1 lysophospholipid acyltransferase family protein [Candidatus Cloacimonadaceae bacterium]
MKSLLWKIWFIFFMLLCLLAFGPLLICKLILPNKSYRKIVNFCTRFWGRTVVLTTGSKVDIEGEDNLPEGLNLCFISNHQGMFDIPLVLGFVPKPTGFIAKQELFKIPVLSWWMREIPCVFIDRGSARKAMESFIKTAEVIKSGHPMVIFPEGTRSQKDEMASFHLGSFKLPAMAGATIVPLAIKDSWKVYEIDKHIHAAHLKLRILKPINVDDPLYKDKHALSKVLHERISAALKDM